ncbi:hypothetical protein [Halorussus halophilus]|uniref:hypothetical protein n=1 Tax=Halorussus halophilus TaxID=2650975 RepID=UPI00130146DE|nr:hypothetical protein [Halorussus halophilus]
MVPSISRRALLRGVAAGVASTAGVGAARAADSEPPERAWSHQYGPDGESLFHDAVATRDGGYLFVGNVGYDASQALAVKTDPWGVTDWTRTYDADNAYFETALEIEDGYLLAGATNLSTDTLEPDESDGWVVRIGEHGAVRWKERYSPKPNTNFAAVTRTPSGFLFAGTTGPSDPDSDRNAGWLFATSENGSRRWSQTYSPSTWHNVTCLAGHDDRYVFGGSTGLDHGSTEDGWTVAVDSEGNELWNRTYGRSHGGDRIEDLLATPDGGYLFAGVTDFSRDDHGIAWLGRLRADGTVAWKRTYDDHGEWAWIDGLARLGDGYVLAGEREPKQTDKRGTWLLGLDSNGSVNWRETYIVTYESVGAVTTSDDGGIVVAGSSGGVGGSAWATKVGGERVSLDWNAASPSSLSASVGLAALGAGAFVGLSERFRQ